MTNSDFFFLDTLHLRRPAFVDIADGSELLLILFMH